MYPRKNCYGGSGQQSGTMIVKCFSVGSAGFTLLEVMLATLVLALVVSMISLSLSGSLHVMEATQDQGEIYYRAQVAMERISDDLASVVLPESADFIGQPVDAAETDVPLLLFYSTAHVVFDPDTDHDGLAVISYMLKPDPENPEMLVLLRSDQLVTPMDQAARQEPEPDYYLLVDRVRSLRFVYLDQNGDEVDSWDTRVDDGASQAERDKARRLPVAVRCELAFWLDPENDAGLSFQTAVEVPAGRIKLVKPVN